MSRLGSEVSDLKTFIQERPKSRSPRVALADWLIKAGRKNEAISELYKLQELLAAQGNVLAAISAGIKIVELDPGFDNPLSYVANVNADRLIEEQQAEDQDEADALVEQEYGLKKQQLLSEIPLLSELTPEELVSVAQGMSRRILYKGAVLTELAGEHPRLLEVLEQYHLERVMEAVQRAKASART